MGAEASKASSSSGSQEISDVVVVQSLYAFEGGSNGELSFPEGCRMVVLDSSNADWWHCQILSTGAEGYVPSNYVEILQNQSFISAPWYHGNISKGAANSLIKFAEPGTFLVRDSQTEQDSYVIVVKSNHSGKAVCNYKISKNEYDRLYISKNITFESLEELVNHYMKNDGLKSRLLQPLEKPKPERDWEVQSIQVTKDDLLGEGNFGQVFRGTMKLENGFNKPVAIKTLKSENMSKEKFLAEAIVMKSLKHHNIVHILAISEDVDNMFIITEFMDKGDLLKVLKSEARLDRNDLLTICHQISMGMEYLESREFIHRDLAARNVLVSSDNVVKLADFGLAKCLQDAEPVYTGSSESVFPPRWSSPEVLDSYQFSIKSDVWAFGITCHEVYNHGEMPYKGRRNQELYHLLKSGFRLPRPSQMPLDIYQLIRSCWEDDPTQRPSFAELQEMLREKDYVHPKSN